MHNLFIAHYMDNVSFALFLCEAIWDKLSPTELPQPTEEDWKKKTEEFYSLFQFPNCTGAIDCRMKNKHRITVGPFL